MSNMGRCGQHGCAFSVRLVNRQRDEYCPECEIDRLRADRDAARAEVAQLQQKLHEAEERAIGDDATFKRLVSERTVADQQRDAALSERWKLNAEVAQARAERDEAADEIDRLRAERDAARQEAAAAQAEAAAMAATVMRLGTETDKFVPWLKEGESPFERLERERRDNDALMTLLAQRTAALARLQHEREGLIAPCMCCREVTQPCQHGCGCSVDPTETQEPTR